MKKIILFFVLSAVIMLPQERGSNVELPEFVITGQDLINLQQTKKPESDLIPVISQDFLTPSISPEEIDIKDVEGPSGGILSLRDTSFYNNGRINATLGSYTIPSVDAAVSAPLGDVLLSGFLKGENVRPYVRNGERYALNTGVDLSIFSGYESSFLPGTQYSFSGDFLSRSYKFYAGIPSNTKRTLYQGTFGAAIKNIYYDKFLIGAAADYRTLSISEEKFAENTASINGFMRMNLGDFNGGVYIDFSNQSFSDSSSAGSSYYYFAARPYAGFELSRFLKASFGINYAHSSGNDFFSPYASVGFRLAPGFTIQGEFSPETEFLTASEFLDRNMYFNPENVPNVFVEKTNNISGSVKYEFSRYFEINAGFRFTHYKNIPYFTEMFTDGTFSVRTAEADAYNIFFNFLFNKGPFGYFYGSAEAGEVKDEGNNYVPYFPSIISSLTYGYEFPIGLNAESQLIYRSGVYADTANTSKIDAFVNLNINLSYKISENLKLLFGVHNLLDRRNVFWNNYREKPLDLSAGISYIW